MSKHWKRFAAVVVSLTMAFQFCVNDFYAYAETGTSQTDSVEETNTGQPPTPAEPTESTEPAPEAETDTTDPAQTPAEDTASGQESQDSDPAQGQTPVNEEEQPQEEATSTNESTVEISQRVEEKQPQGTAPQPEVPQQRISASILNLAPNSATISNDKFQFVDENGETIDSSSIPTSIGTGSIETILANVSIEGYDFVNATVNGVPISEIGTYKNYVYYVLEDDPSTAQLLGESTIVFNYELHVNTYTINYEVLKGIDYNGPSSVREGDSYSFTATPSGKGKQLTVTVNGEDISSSGVVVNASSGMTRYTVDNVQDNQSVAIIESDVSNYVFTYTDNIRQGRVISPANNTNITAGSEFAFQIISDVGGGAEGNLWHLNLLAINGEYINVPTTFNEGDTTETVLSSGEKVTVTLLDDRYGYDYDWYLPNQRCYQYNVTVSNVYTNIAVTDGNFKDADRNEIILKRLDGVSDIVGWDYADERYEAGTINSVYKQTDNTGNEFYFNLAPGYTNPTVMVLANGAQTGITVQNVADMDPGDITARGYTYQFNVSNRLSDNVEVYITAERQYYKVQYEVDEEIVHTDATSYSIFSGDNNTATIWQVPEYDSTQYVFEGWEYNGVVYQPYDVFEFNENTVVNAENGIITFKAKLVKIAESDYVPYTVRYLFQRSDGSHVQRVDYPEEKGYGIKDTTLFWYKALTMDIEGYTIDSDDSDVTLMLSGDTENVSEIRFDLDENNNGVPDDEETKYTLTYDGNGNTSGTAPAAEEHVEKAEIALAGKGDLERDKATFLGWSQTQTNLVTSKEEAEAAKIITTLTMPGKDTTVYAVWASDLDEDGTPDYSEDKYDLIYDVNGGQNGPVTESNAYINKQIVRLDSKTIPTKEGAIFLGWSETRITENLTAAPSEGIIVTEVTFEESDKIVYAVWAVDNNDNDKPDYSEAYSLTIYYQYAQGEEGDDDLLPETYNQSEMKVGEAYNVASPEVEGYVARPTAITGTIDKSNVEETVTYYRDSNGNGEPDQEDNRYTVRFLDYDGTVLSIQSVLEGMSAVAPTNPTRDGYTFTGWDRGFDNITSDLDVNAQYQANPAPVVPDDDDDDTPTTPTTSGGGEGTGTTPATGGPVAAADDDADAEDEPEEEEVEDEETPLSDGEEEVDEGKTPLAKIDVWALINLIAAIITVLFGLILLLSKRHKNDDEEDEEERQARIERGEEKEQEQKRGWICKVLGVLVAIGSVVLFILTEDMSLPMAMTDEWTIWMIIIAVVELVLLLVGRHWKDVDDDEEEQAQA